MCGVTAIIAPDPTVSPVDLIGMTHKVMHRGPDDGGYVFFDQSEGRVPYFFSDTSGALSAGVIFNNTPSEARFRVGLGHRRLSIIDLSSAGRQPMATPDKRYWVTYNGEIYNHAELREELERLGAEFHSHSDTEVLLTAYAMWGKECLKRFNGMFAFVLYDRIERRVFAARDRYGVKPLYHWRSPQGVLHFASELKQFTTLPGWQAQLNRARAYDFLAWGLTDHTRETCFQNVYQIPPGHYLSFQEKELAKYPNSWQATPREHSWYQLQPACPPNSFDDAADILREKLISAISYRLRSDVRIGANLSGGLDSSTIVCLIDEMNRKTSIGEPFYCVSIGSKYSQFDERQFINLVLDRVHAQRLFLEIRFEDLLQDIDQLIWHQEEPFASTSIFADWCVYRKAADAGIKVMLGGQGADEQLAGYPEYMGHFYRSWLSNGAILEVLRDLHAAHKNRGAKWSFLLVRLADALLPQVLRQRLRRLHDVPSSNPFWLNPQMLGIRPHDSFETYGFRSTSVREASRAQLERTNLPMQLKWEDRDSMAHSVESRAPYLDVDLVEYLYGIQDSFRYYLGESKRILRHAMRGRVPDPVLDRRDKMGFVTPESVWVQGQGGQFFLDQICAAADICGGIIRPDAIKYFGEMIEGRRRYSHSLWRAISFGMWIKRFNVTI